MVRRLFRKARRWLASDYVAVEGARLPPARLRFCGPEFRDDRYFLASARREADRLAGVCGLQPSGRVLDVGCGPGRLAIGILDRLGAVAEYRGVDVHRPSIEWCRRNLGRDNPTFHFDHIDVANARYNPAGGEGACTVRLPGGQGAYDVVYLYSVFSHMLPADVRGYLREMRRVLAPGGTIFFTAFVERDVPPVTENPAGYVRAWAGPLHCIRYEQEFLGGMLREVGLEILEAVPGAETDGQSAIYARAE
jgi:SAM-dependent methyltransferase